MAQNDKLATALSDLAAGFVLLTRLPVRAPETAFTRGAAAAWAWPLVGGVLGAITGCAAWALLALGLPAPLAAGLCLALAALMTGAMHEDGLADSADGFWGGWEPARRLEIMKDSHIGSYGVIALILSLGLRWIALSAVFEAGLALPVLVAVGALSRAAMPALMHALPAAREGGLSRSVGRVPFDMAVLASVIAVVVALLTLGLAALTLVLAAMIVAWAVAALARAKIGGQTGDVLGAAQQMVEIVCLLVLASL
jgi:adenosylcobinamide-GDP ribazoletransferase